MATRQLHVLAGRIVEIGAGYVLLGLSSVPILLTDNLARGFHAGQRVKITAVLVGDQFLAQKIELAPREALTRSAWPPGSRAPASI